MGAAWEMEHEKGLRAWEGAMLVNQFTEFNVSISVLLFLSFILVKHSNFEL